jgi:hypothetical protein
MRRREKVVIVILTFMNQSILNNEILLTQKKAPFESLFWKQYYYD